MSKFKRELSILVIEDNKDHVKIIQWAFQKISKKTRLTYAEDGESVLQNLDSPDRDAAEAKPDLIMLDLNLPRMHGNEVLKLLKENENLKHIPVIIMSSSDRDEDVREAYRLGANTFLTKSMVFNDFENVIEKLHEYWSSIALLPG